MAQLIGMAKPMFCAFSIMAVLIPIASPLIFIRGPPEFPSVSYTHLSQGVFGSSNLFPQGTRPAFAFL